MLRWPLPSFKGSPKIRASRTSGAPQYGFVGFPLAGFGITSAGAPVIRGGVATDTIPDAGPLAISLATATTLIALTGASDVAYTLAAGVEGQEKTIILSAKSGVGNAVITPATFHGYTSVTLREAGASVTLRYEGGEWGIIGLGGRPAAVSLDTMDQTVTAAGALTPLAVVTRLQTASGSDVAITLANLAPTALNNFEKLIYLETKGGAGNYVLTPTSLFGFTTITFNSVGDAVLLRWCTGIGEWVIASNQGATLA